MIKIGLVMPLAELRGGVERMLMNLLAANRATPRAEFDVVFMQDGPMVASVRALGYPARIISAGRLRDPITFYRATRALGLWMDETRPSAVLSWAAKGHLYAGLPARRRGLASAWFLHAIPDGHWMDRLTTALPADVVLCCSNAAEQAQRKLTPTRPTRVVHIAVDLDAFDPERLPTPAEARVVLGLPPEGQVVMMVARLQRWKGVHVFVEAAAHLASSWPDAQFVVVGGEHAMEPGYRAELERLTAERAIGSRMTFAGLQSDVPLWMQAADVIVHASFDEPAGAVIIEGMAMGKPVIAARTAGPMEFIEDGVDGCLTPPGDAVGLATAIADLLRDESARTRLGRAARQRAAHFSAPRFTCDVISAMESIAVRPRAKATV